MPRCVWRFAFRRCGRIFVMSTLARRSRKQVGQCRRRHRERGDRQLAVAQRLQRRDGLVGAARLRADLRQRSGRFDRRGIGGDRGAKKGRRRSSRTRAGAQPPTRAELAAAIDQLERDGRIADIAETGFLDGVLVIPQFVLRELRL